MRLALALLLCTVIAGCGTTYYMVKDPATGREYYTTEIEKDGGGAVSLKDGVTNAHVTIQNSEIMEISGDQYDAAIRTPAAPVATPTPAPTPPAASTPQD